MSTGEPGAAGAAANGGWRRRTLVFAILAATVVAMLATFTFRSQRYVRSDPRFCTESCHHQKDVAGAAHAGGHVGVACQSCHVVPAGAAMKLLWQSWTKAKQPLTHGATDETSCRSCHEQKPAEYRLVTETAGHRKHAGPKGVSCVSCHASSIHGEQPIVQTCITCHKDEKLHTGTTHDAETCLSCHAFAVSPERVQKPTTTACETCHASKGALAASLGPSSPPVDLKDVNAQVLHGGVACQLCHNAHGTKPRAPPGQPVCASCHQFEIIQHGPLASQAPEGHRNCEGCHKPHTPVATARVACAKCHEAKAAGLSAGGTSTAVKHQACSSCHIPHSWKAERSACVQCHADKANLIATESPKQHGTCTNCHEVHGPPPTGAVCVTCHAKTKGNHVALAPEKHKNCTACHDPHSPSPRKARTACANCHSWQLGQVMRDGPEGHTKESCFGCHKPHDNPRPPPTICANCHADKAKLVATAGPANHKVCGSCHEKHVFKVGSAAKACGACHGPFTPYESSKVASAPVLDGTMHRDDCKKCHTPHGPTTVPKTACFKCHDKIEAGFKPPNETHANCRSCHQPHKPASTAVAKCATCHEAKATIAAMWPAASAHAQKCTGCHAQHDVATKKPCASCHSKESANATGGKHQCTQCHAPHAAPPGTGAAWWTRCNTCHAAKVESVKALGTTHSKCKNCHEPHKFAVPTCTTCHKDMSKKGLHARPTHAANCNKCHDPHIAAEPTRAQCIGCHANKTTHQPDAKKCQACHLFQ